MEPHFFDISAKIETKPPGISKIFLVDMPGIGGLQINAAGYFLKFGPGHFDLSFLVADSGFNEFENYFLKHLIRNGKKIVYVRSKCDAAMIGLQEEKQEVWLIYRGSPFKLTRRLS